MPVLSFVPVENTETRCSPSDFGVGSIVQFFWANTEEKKNECMQIGMRLQTTFSAGKVGLTAKDCILILDGEYAGYIIEDKDVSVKNVLNVTDFVRISVATESLLKIVTEADRYGSRDEPGNVYLHHPQLNSDKKYWIFAKFYYKEKNNWKGYIGIGPNNIGQTYAGETHDFEYRGKAAVAPRHQNEMNPQEAKNAKAAQAMARSDTSESEPRFHGWYYDKGRWVGWYDGGRVVWLKDNSYAFEAP